MKVKLSLSREKRSLGHENARGLILRAVKAAQTDRPVRAANAVSAASGRAKAAKGASMQKTAAGTANSNRAGALSRSSRRKGVAAQA